VKKCLAIVFLLIFSFQVLPVKEIGKLLFKNTTTEEEVHGSSDDNANKGKFGEDLFLEYSASRQVVQPIYFVAKVAVSIHAADDLPPIRIKEVQSPPPDFPGSLS
jgi:hypothetical protein